MQIIAQSMLINDLFSARKAFDLMGIDVNTGYHVTEISKTDGADKTYISRSNDCNILCHNAYRR